MHDTALAIGAAVMAEYTGSRPTIVEIGAMNVNGTLRSVAPARAKYIGIDQQTGPGVNLVVPAGTPIPVEAGTADLVMASSVFEHDMMFWETFSQMCRLAKPGGYVYLNAPSNGCVHSYPVDCWRFYPDAGMALERYSEKTEWPVKLIESFTAERQGDQWNDFVAVFQRIGGSRKKKHTHVYHQFNSKNVYAENLGQRINLEDFPEDVRIVQSFRLKVSELEAALEAAQANARHLSQEVATRDNRIGELEVALGATQADTGRLSQEVAARDSRISELEVALAATQADAGRLSQEVATRDSRISELDVALAATQADIGRLSQEVAARDSRISELEVALAATQADAGRLSQEVATRDSRIGELEAALATTQADTGRLSQEVAARDSRIGELEVALAATQADAERLAREATDSRIRISELEVSQVSAQGEAERLAKELAIQVATVTELRRFVTTLSELTMALRSNPKVSWNPFRLFRRTAPPILLGRAETETMPYQSQNKP